MFTGWRGSWSSWPRAAPRSAGYPARAAPVPTLGRSRQGPDVLRAEGAAGARAGATPLSSQVMRRRGSGCGREGSAAARPEPGLPLCPNPLNTGLSLPAPPPAARWRPRAPPLTVSCGLARSFGVAGLTLPVPKGASCTDRQEPSMVLKSTLKGLSSRLETPPSVVSRLMSSRPGKSPGVVSRLKMVSSVRRSLACIFPVLHSTSRGLNPVGSGMVRDLGNQGVSSAGSSNVRKVFFTISRFGLSTAPGCLSGFVRRDLRGTHGSRARSSLWTDWKFVKSEAGICGRSASSSSVPATVSSLFALSKLLNKEEGRNGLSAGGSSSTSMSRDSVMVGTSASMS
mmetsp:Transcript_125232/g.348455  ORF Transcript_125232/g.348455 Transcript_125232/m.348455 type:complete len:341 (-) Transcript_125232:985-2007(-)